MQSVFIGHESVSNHQKLPHLGPVAHRLELPVERVVSGYPGDESEIEQHDPLNDPLLCPWDRF